MQWYDVLLVEVERQIENAVQRSRDHIKASLRASPTPSANSSECISELNTLPAPILVQRCPACFGGARFGTPLGDGGDFHLATDGNFHHRHRRSAGNSPSFYNPSYFLSKEQVNAMGDRIAKAQKKPVKSYQQIVPDEAIDECESSYEAADGKKEKATTEAFDDTGLMALICRHDIPLFFCEYQHRWRTTEVPPGSHRPSILPSSFPSDRCHAIRCRLRSGTDLVQGRREHAPFSCRPLRGFLV